MFEITDSESAWLIPSALMIVAGLMGAYLMRPYEIPLLLARVSFVVMVIGLAIMAAVVVNLIAAFAIFTGMIVFMILRG